MKTKQLKQTVARANKTLRLFVISSFPSVIRRDSLRSTGVLLPDGNLAGWASIDSAAALSQSLHTQLTKHTPRGELWLS